MTTPAELRNILEKIHKVNNETEINPDRKEEVWKDLGADLLIAIDKLVVFPELVNASIPRDYSPENACPVAGMFSILSNMISVNKPFSNHTWDSYQEGSRQSADGQLPSSQAQIAQVSFYELAMSRCCGLICELLGDRVQYIQKLLLKNIFGLNNVCSLFASDMYMFIYRIIHPHQKMAMCQIIMNICRYAPPEAVVKGAALVNRLKHPIVNFENSKYLNILELV